MPEIAMRIEIPYPAKRGGLTVPGAGLAVISPVVRAVSTADMRPVLVTPGGVGDRFRFDDVVWGPLSPTPGIRMTGGSLSAEQPLAPLLAARLGLRTMADVVTGPYPWSGTAREIVAPDDPTWRETTEQARRTVEANLLSVDGTLYRRSGPPVLVLHAVKGMFCRILLADSSDLPESATATCFGTRNRENILAFAEKIAPRRHLALPDHVVADGEMAKHDDRKAFAAGAASWLDRELRRFHVGMFPGAAIRALRALRNGATPAARIAAFRALGEAFGVETDAPLTAMRPLEADTSHYGQSDHATIAAGLALVTRRAAWEPGRLPEDDDDDILGDLAF